MDYLLIDPGKTNEHTNQRVITGSLGCDEGRRLSREEVQQVATDLQAYQDAWQSELPDGHIWQCSLSIKSSEGVLSDDKWRSISKDFMEKMGLTDPREANLRWVSVRHGLSAKNNDHVHIAASLVRENGSTANVWNDRIRSQAVCTDLEKKHGLEVLQRRGARAFTSAELKHHGEPERVKLERLVRAASVGVLDDTEFFSRLEASNVKVRPYVQDGVVTGYSVALGEKNAQRFAGGKLARDLSLPRLQQYWKNNSTDTPKHMQAVQELLQMQRDLPVASVEKLADASHQLAGALAVVSRKTEPEPGPIAQASSEAGRLAQTRTYTQRPKPPALSVAMLFLMATDPAGPVGKAVMIKQLMATYRALLNAHAARSYVANPERTAMAGAGAEDEMLEMGVTAGITAGAVVMERHALHKSREQQQPAPRATRAVPVPEQWDRNTIRAFREQDKWDKMRERAAGRAAAPQITHEQKERIAELAEQFGSPGMNTGITEFTKLEAEQYIAHLQSNVYTGPTPGEHVILPQTHAQEMADVDKFMDDLEAKHGHKDLSTGTHGPAAAAWESSVTAAPDAQEQGPILEVPETWRTKDEPITPAQVHWLTTKGGMSAEDVKDLTKGGASNRIREISNPSMQKRQNAAAVTLTPAASKNVQPPQKGYTRGR